MDRSGHKQEAQTDTRPAEFSTHSVRLAWILAAAYLLVIAYASLQPLRGWRAPPEEILHFLVAPWPRFITLQDVAVNIAAYVPLGLLLSIGCSARYGPARGTLVATLAAALLSLAMEAAQMFLPTRIASNIDLLANTLGALLGAMAAPLLAPSRNLGGKLHGARRRLFADGMTAEAGLVIVFLWLAAQFHPTAKLFATGAIRATFDLPALFAHTPWLAFASEAVAALFNLLGVGLMVLALMRETARPVPVIGALIGAALVIKLVNATVMVQAPAPLAWLTPGVTVGLFAACALLWAGALLPRRWQLAVSAACIAIAAAAINFAPDNPYQNVPPRLLARVPGHFLSFSSIVRALSELWPLLAIGFTLYALGVRRHRI